MEAPCGRKRSMELSLVRSTWLGHQLTSPSAESLVGGPLWQLCTHWHCPKSVPCSGGPFDPCEAERHVLIGRMFVTCIMLALFMHFHPKYTCTHI
jgi:hypothetical protein